MNPQPCSEFGCGRAGVAHVYAEAPPDSRVHEIAGAPQGEQPSRWLCALHLRHVAPLAEALGLRVQRAML